MRSLQFVSTLFVVAPLLVACKEPTEVCAGVGYDAVTVDIRDGAGKAQAFGATVNLYDGSYHEQDVASDTLTVLGAEERGGRTYDIEVTKPFYQAAWVGGVHAPGGGCVTRGVSITVPVTLSLAPNAPAVRSLFLMPSKVTMDRPPNSIVQFIPYIDANAGTSHAVVWRLTGDTASIAFDPATGTATYRCLPQSGYLTLTATSVADSAVVNTARIAVQGHPAATDDPPCT